MRLLIIIICFAMVYYVARRLIIDWVRSLQARKSDSHRDSRRDYEYDLNRHQSQDSSAGHSWDLEMKYREILGLGKNDGIGDIKNKYRELISKYHPDKVQHLGKEFQELAEAKTKEILQAYQYFQKKYDL